MSKKQLPIKIDRDSMRPDELSVAEIVAELPTLWRIKQMVEERSPIVATFYKDEKGRASLEVRIARNQ